MTETPYCKICPECGCTCGSEAEKCDECGADLSSVSAEYDELTDRDNAFNMLAAVDKVNEHLAFFKVTVESGYYCGLQFFVDTEKGSPEEMDNGDCQYYFGKCRSKAIRAYKAEIRYINKWLAQQGEELGLTELICTAIFSNGEAMYVRANRKLDSKAA